MSEFLIIMENGATKEQIDRVIKAVQSNKGKLQQRYPPQIIIGREGEDIKKRLTNPKLEGVSAVYLSDEDPEELGLDNVGSLRLGDVGSLAVQGWIVRNSKEYRKKKNDRKIKRRRHRHPDHVDVAALGAPPAMIGTATVGIIIVKGPHDAGFSSIEEQLVITEAQEGMDQLTQLAPPAADLIFVPDIQIVNLSVSPNDVDGTKDTEDWRNPAMAELGFGSGNTGIDDYLRHLHTSNGSAWEYIAFFTKYKTAFRNMAFYTPPGDARYCVLRYPQAEPREVKPFKYNNYSGHPPDHLDMLFAHETGHICGAGDENSLAVDCLMSNLDHKVCKNTRAFFQWNTLPL